MFDYEQFDRGISLTEMLWKGTLTILTASVTLLGSLDPVQSLSPQEAQLNVAAGKALNDSLLWGTYRPNLYFGTRPRIPESLLTGIMWFSGDNAQGFQRESCVLYLSGIVVRLVTDLICKFRHSSRLRARGWFAWIWLF